MIELDRQHKIREGLNVHEAFTALKISAKGKLFSDVLGVAIFQPQYEIAREGKGCLERTNMKEKKKSPRQTARQLQ